MVQWNEEALLGSDRAGKVVSGNGEEGWRSCGGNNFVFSAFRSQL